MNDIITLRVNGVELQTFESITLTSSMKNMCAGFSFTYTPKFEIKNGKYTPIDIINEEDEVEIFINDILYLTGRVDDIQEDEDEETDTKIITGRDKIGYIIDSFMTPKIYTERNLQVLLQTVLEDNGWGNKVAIKNITDEEIIVDTQEEDIHTEANETMLDFFNRYADKCQVLLGSGNSGDIFIYREGNVVENGGRFATKQEAPIALIKTFGGQNNNILKCSRRRSIKERYQIVEIYSQNNNNFHSIKDVSPVGRAIDNQILTPRKVRILAQNPAQKTTLDKLAKWRINLKRAKSSQYDCTVQGISYAPNNKDYWKINTYVKVLDEKRAIDGEFLIEEVTFTKDLNGTFTELKIVNKNSYTLDTEQAIQRKNRNKFGNF